MAGLLWLLGVGLLQAQPTSQPMPVLLLSPAGGELQGQRTEIVRGLRAAQLRAMQVADVSLDPVFAACRQSSCAAEAARTAGMPALLCSVRGGIAELRWVAPEDGLWTERAEVARGGLSGAIRELARRILLRRALGPRALLRVDSHPVGASVLVDGKLAGITPLEQAWEPGAHVISVEMEGYRSQQTDARLGSGDLSAWRFDLQPEQGPAFQPQRAVSPANYVLGSVLALAALPLVIAGSNAFIDAGQCLSSDAGSCTQRGEGGTAAGTMLVGGAASLLASVYFFIAQPVRVRVDLPPQAAAVSVRGRF